MTDNTQEPSRDNRPTRENLALLIGLILGVIFSGGWWFIIFACRLKPDLCPF